jgi:ubiquinone/menaquinone biosynthesis C-methylase UbiE
MPARCARELRDAVQLCGKQESGLDLAVLDIGAGRGLLAVEMNKLTTNGNCSFRYHMTALDVSASTLAESERTGLYTEGCLVHDANKGLHQFQDEQFDAVVCVGTAVYLDPKIVLPEMIRVVKKGTGVIVITYDGYVKIAWLEQEQKLKNDFEVLKHIAYQA